MVTRKLLFIIVILHAFAVISCARDTHASLQVSYPYLNDARNRAAQAITYAQTGATDKAQEELDIALQEAPNDPLVLDALGYYFEQAGDIAEAKNFYFKALLLAPQSGTIRNNYGAFLCRNGYSNEAINYFMQAAVTPGYPYPKKAYANALYCSQMLGVNKESAYHNKLLWSSFHQLGYGYK